MGTMSDTGTGREDLEAPIQEISCPVKLAESLEEMLEQFFETKSGDFLKLTRTKVRFLEVPAGTTLFEEGDTDDDLYFVLRGRLRAIRSGPRGQRQTIGEIGRGETIGELALISGEPRSASILALRDSVVARLTREAFCELLGYEPTLALTVVKGVIERFRRTERLRQPPQKPVNLCLVALHETINAADFAALLAEARRQYGGAVHVVTEADAAAANGLERVTTADRESVAEWITKLEATAEAVFLVTSAPGSAWSLMCAKLADEIVLLADSKHSPGLTPPERALFDGEDAAPAVMRTLVLFHDRAKASPTGTSAWLNARPACRHFHYRPGHAPDLRRLNRIFAGRAVGLVLAGGGARAFVHFGVINALAEAGIEPDFLGGTSMGATAAAWRALDLTGDDLVAAGRKVYLNKPTSDINPLPMMSVIKGKRVRRITGQAVRDAAGADIDIEDMWLPYFCIATNLSASEQAILHRGPLTKSLLASFSIPGALPPVIICGQLMVDGGTFNNFPVDVMETLGVGKIIGVITCQQHAPTLELEELPDSFPLLLDRFRPRLSRRFHLPLLPEILISSTISSSINRQRLAINRVDLLFEPAVERIGLLEWDKYDSLIQEAHRDTRRVLAEMDPEKIRAFQ